MVALVTGGETARTTWSDSMLDNYSAVVGVNWASHHYTTHWLVALDPIVWRMERVSRMIMPDIGLVSYENQPEDVNAILKANDLALIPFGDRITDRVKGICTLTFPYALRFCLANWPDSSVDVYGLDMDNRRGLSPMGPEVRKPSPRWNNRRRSPAPSSTSTGTGSIW